MPPADDSADAFDYDPKTPVADTVGKTCWGLARELGDRRELEARPDVLVYSSGPLEKDIEITGPIAATLYVSSSAVDTDFWVGLVHVRADGYATLLQDGILKTSFRDGKGNAPPLEPGQIYKLDIDLWSTSLHFKQGEQIRVEISSSAFNKYNRNTNTGEPIADASRTIVARQTVHYGGEHPSKIVLPVVSG